jgi:parvulin-like peptidyl-prolyl isomerase
MTRRTWAVGAMLAGVSLGAVAAEVRAQSADKGKPPAVVNGQVISRAELDAAMRQAGPSPTPMTEMQRRQMQMQALNYLIDQALMTQFLAKSAKPVDAAEVQQKIAEMEAGLRRQGKTLQDVCREANQTEAQFRAVVAHNLQWYAYARQQVSESDLEQYYKENKDLFDRVTVRVSHILLPLPSSATESERAATRARLEGIRAQILAGKVTFADAAKAQSQGPTADKGGDLGYIPRKWVVEEPFAKVAFGMQVGQISDIVETEFGFQLIQVTDRKAGQPSEFAKIKEDVMQVCIEDMYMNVLAQLRKTGKVEVNLP